MTAPQPQPSLSPPVQQPRGHRPYLVIIVVLLVALVASSGGIAYLFALKSSDLNSQIQRTSDLNSQNSNLQNQISQLNSKNTNLQNQITQLQNQVDSLQSQVTNLQSQLSNTVNVTGLSGTVSVSSATPVSIIFYSGSSKDPTVSSTVFTDNSYFVIVDNGVTYTAVIVYVSSGTIYHCNATPSVYTTPSGPSTSISQNFF